MNVSQNQVIKTPLLHLKLKSQNNGKMSTFHKCRFLITYHGKHSPFEQILAEGGPILTQNEDFLIPVTYE